MAANPRMGVMEIPSLTCEYLTVVQVHVPWGQFTEAPLYIISGYFRLNVPIERILAKLEAILEVLDGAHIIIAADSNARSPLWHDPHGNTCPKGAILERFISAHDLRVHNTPNLLTTFQSHAGQTNIDVTLSTRDIPVPVVRWNVHDDATSSNHRLITFSLEVDSGTEEADEDRMRFNLKDADWGKFGRVLRTKLSQAPPVEPGLSQKDFIDSTVAELTRVYQNTCTETLKRTRLPRYKKTIWWSFRLERMKKRNVRLRRTYQRTMDADLRAQRASVWRAFQARYKNAIREARENSYERATLDDLQKNPFGMLYKTSAKKYSCKRMLAAVRTADSGDTLTIEATLQAYLNALVPSDEHDRAIPLLGHGNENNTPLEISRAEVRQAITDIKTHKAPGYDNIPGTAIKNSVNLVEGIFTELARNCAEVGYFPDDWKVGNLVHIPKGPDKDPHSLKSYRPLTMLCEFSKVLERIIKTKIHELASSPISPANQFGFVSGSSTIHSMLELSRIIDCASDKYVLVIFIDIKGAFDNVRWHRVIERMVEINLPAKLISLVASYFSNRTIVLEAERHKIQKQATRGCPQGSILGPEFWNLVVADLLMIPLPVGVNLLAYADDVAVTIEGNTRVELERKAAAVTSELERWMELNQLSVSIEKCQYVMFKGDFHKWTSPRIIIGGQRLKRVSQVKYLGVTWDEKRTFRAHVANVTADAIRNFTSLRRFFYSNWGDRPPALTKIYRGAIVPKVTYAAAIWGHTIQDRQVKSKLLTCQRYCTIAISASAATVSHAAAQVLAGEPPLHMVVSEVRARELLRIRGTTPVVHLGAEFESAPGVDLKVVLRQRTIDMWQEECDGCAIEMKLARTTK
ncbi:hypothetical protein M8J76_001812 [Diaphorina citri]|nr:hypothetical protein M8J76_001812 [Diaphorina citri]